MATETQKNLSKLQKWEPLYQAWKYYSSQCNIYTFFFLSFTSWSKDITQGMRMERHCNYIIKVNNTNSQKWEWVQEASHSFGEV